MADGIRKEDVIKAIVAVGKVIPTDVDRAMVLGYAAVFTFAMDGHSKEELIANLSVAWDNYAPAIQSTARQSAQRH